MLADRQSCSNIPLLRSACVSVLRVDAGSLAEGNGLKVGDQIVQLNGASLENVTHANAVEMMRAERQLVLTVLVSRPAMIAWSSPCW